MMRYNVNLKKTDEGFAIWVPGLPGCWSQEKTEPEALDNISDRNKPPEGCQSFSESRLLDCKDLDPEGKNLQM